MRYLPLGKSTISISEIGFGCMSLNENTLNNRMLLMNAFKNGITYFDTADLYNYGANERMVGQALKTVRSKVVISTKVGNVWRKDRSGWDWNPNKEYILKAIEESLKRLQTDYIDLYMLHGGTLEDPIDDIIEAFEILKKEGKIRAYGISSIRPNVIKEYVKRSALDAVMMQYSLLDRRPEECCLELLYENKISLLSRGSLAKGLLVDKPASSYLNYSLEEVEMLLHELKKLSAGSRMASELAVRYVLNHPVVSSAVVGIRTIEQLHEAIHIASSSLLNLNEEKMLKDILHPLVYTDHR